MNENVTFKAKVDCGKETVVSTCWEQKVDDHWKVIYADRYNLT